MIEIQFRKGARCSAVGFDWILLKPKSVGNSFVFSHLGYFILKNAVQINLFDTPHTYGIDFLKEQTDLYQR
jgi:hypothetical protein